MDTLDFKVLQQWFDNIVQILQWVAVVLALAHISMRVKWLKKAIRGAQTNWYAGLIASIFFGLLAILGNHSRIIWETNINTGHLEIMQYLSSQKFPGQASVSLRDLMILVAGLSAGPWVGLGSGLIAGSERFFNRRAYRCNQWHDHFIIWFFGWFNAPLLSTLHIKPLGNICFSNRCYVNQNVAYILLCQRS